MEANNFPYVHSNIKKKYILYSLYSWNRAKGHQLMHYT